MPSSKTHISNINKDNINLLMFFNLFVAFIASLFLAWNDVKAGTIYSWMFVGFTSLFFLVFFFLKDDNRLKPITDYIKIPFAVKNTLAVSFYLLGMFMPFVIQGILKVFGSFNITSFAIPLFGNEIAGAQFQSFAASEIGSSLPWKIFTIMFAAGNIETYVYPFGMFLIGVLIGVFIWSLVADGNSLGFVSKRGFVIGTGMFVSVGLFILSHMLNNTYAGIMFVIAGIFLLVNNLTIYYVGVFLTFWAGYHQSNNLLYLIQEYGVRTILLEGFVSWFGLFFTVYIALLVYYVLRKLQSGQLSKDLRAWFRS